jgi:hypothetical protein
MIKELVHPPVNNEAVVLTIVVCEDTDNGRRGLTEG